jgi:hypothetical protein
MMAGMAFFIWRMRTSKNSRIPQIFPNFHSHNLIRMRMNAPFDLKQRWSQRVLAGFLLAFPFILQAQTPASASTPSQQLRGRLINSRTGEPLDAVILSSRAVQVLLEADQDGQFVMNLPSAEHIDTLGLTLSRVGMEPRRVLIFLERDTTLTQVTIALDLGDVVTVIRPPNQCGCSLPDLLPIDLTQLAIQAPKVKYVRNPEISPTGSGWHIEY